MNETLDRVRLRTQRVLGTQKPSFGLLLEVIKILQAREKALVSLMSACVEAPFALACPECGEVWWEDEGPAGWRLCKACRFLSGDPWDSKIPADPDPDPEPTALRTCGHCRYYLVEADRCLSPYHSYHFIRSPSFSCTYFDPYIPADPPGEEVTE